MSTSLVETFVPNAQVVQVQVLSQEQKQPAIATAANAKRTFFISIVFDGLNCLNRCKDTTFFENSTIFSNRGAVV